MKRCSKCDQSKHNRCLQGSCECLCQYGDNRKEAEYELKLDSSQDEFYERMKTEWKSLNQKEPAKKKATN